MGESQPPTEVGQDVTADFVEESPPAVPRTIERPESMEERFAEDCGGRLSVSICAQGDDDVTITTLDGPYGFVGRDPSCAVVLTSDDVSRRHAYLQVVGQQIFFADLGSRKGIFRDGRLSGSGLLHEGESLQVGPYRIRVSIVPLGQSESIPENEEGPPRFALDFVNHRSHLRPWNIERDVTLIGSARPTKVRLEHSEVSRVHCAIVRGREEWWILDTMSRRGTLADGCRVQLAPLSFGNLIKIGPYEIGIQEPTDSEADSDESILEDRSPGTSLVTEIARTARETAFASRQSSRRAAPAVTEQLVIELFREFASLHERTISQIQQSFREMLDVAVTARSGERIRLPQPSEPESPPSQESPKIEKPLEVADRDASKNEEQTEPAPVASHHETVAQALTSNDAGEREAAHDLLTAQLRSIEMQLEKDRKGIAKRLMRSLSLR